MFTLRAVLSIRFCALELFDRLDNGLGNVEMSVLLIEWRHKRIEVAGG